MTTALLAHSVPAASTDEASSLPSFSEAVDLHKAMVFSIGWHSLRDRSAAEELAQDVFLALHRNWTSMKSAEHIHFWLRKSATNRAIDLARRRKTRGETSLEENAEPPVVEPERDAFLTAYLQRMVASLPAKQRLLVILRYGEEMEIDDIARVTATKPATVKTQLFRALELLRAKSGRRLGKDTAEAAELIQQKECT